MGVVTIGADIGQKRDPTAIAVAELEWRTVDGRTSDHHLIRHLERLPLGTPYPAVAARLNAVVAALRQRRAGGTGGVGAGGTLAALYVDATGVGQPVVDLLTVRGVRTRAVYFTHGDRRVTQDDGSVSLGKAWLVSRLQALLQTGRILLPHTDEARALARELQDYEIRVSEQANDTYGAFKVGTHDDLVTALGLAVQEVARTQDAPAASGPPRYHAGGGSIVPDAATPRGRW